MIRPPLLRLFVIFSWAVIPAVIAQTQTVADPNVPGNSIVEVITQGANGVPVTQTLQIITAGSNQGPGGGQGGGAASITTTAPGVQTTTSTAASTSTTATAAAVVTVGPGPVAQPAPTVPVGEGTTSYQYTTTDQLGETTVLHDIFTPTYNVLPSPSAPGVGTVLPFNQWTAIIGTNTVGSPTNAAVGWRLSGARGILIVIGGIIAGAFTVL